MHRYKINVEYKGTDYVGWQRQDNGMSIQESLEKAIKQLTSEKVDVFGAGRTDSGVHALNQVAHFDLKKIMELDSIRDGLNQYLRPQPIAIIKVEEVSSDFHARFSARQREYSYKIVNRRAPLTVDQGMAWILHKKLNITKMKEAASFFIGKNLLFSALMDSKNSFDSWALLSGTFRCLINPLILYNMKHPINH